MENKIPFKWKLFGKSIALLYIILMPIGIVFREGDYFKIISRFWNLEFIKFEK